MKGEVNEHLILHCTMYIYVKEYSREAAAEDVIHIQCQYNILVA